MNCRETKRYMSAWRDNELDKARSHELAQHLEQCGSCRNEARKLDALATMLQNELTVQIPERLADQVFQAAMSAPTTEPFFLETLFPMAWPAALASSTAATLLVVWSLVSQPVALSTDPFEEILGTAQVQSILHGALGTTGDIP